MNNEPENNSELPDITNEIPTQEINTREPMCEPNNLPVADLQPTKVTTALEERQNLLRHYVRMVCRKQSFGTFCYSKKGGTGKTKTILETLAEEFVSPVVLNSHCTTLSLYSTLYANQEKIIVIDDADSLYRNLAALGILRSALWGNSGDERLVTYNSSTLNLPSSFHFKGAIIMCANTIPKNNPAFEAVLSRIDVIELDASNEEVIDLMKKLAVEGYNDILSAAECLEVVSFIEENASSREISMRLLEPSYQKRIYGKNTNTDWKTLVRSQLEQIGSKANAPKAQESKDFLMQTIKEVIERYSTDPKAQEINWCNGTGKSRATFYRLKKDYLSLPKRRK